MVAAHETFDAEILARYPHLKDIKTNVLKALDVIVQSFKEGGKLLAMGNGGSATDAEHLCVELVKGFRLQRPLHNTEKKAFPEDGSFVNSMLQNGLPALSLSTSNSFLTAFINDVHPEYIFAQQVWVHGKPQDVLVAFTTSGRSKNIILGLKVAKAKGLKTVLFTGATPNAASALADVSIHVPEIDTHKVQDLHLPVYHYLCVEIEKAFFDPEEGHHYKKFLKL